MTRVLVIGLDGFDYALASRWLDELPALAGLAGRGAFGPLESIVPPVTPPAWTSMVTGRDPGHFGFTDFTVRRPGTYATPQLVHSGMVRVDTVFDLADRAGLRTLALGVPVSYPPPPRRHGATLSCLMAPSAERRVTDPPELQERWLGLTSQPFLFDVASTDPDVRGDPGALLAKLRRFDDQRFDLAQALAGQDDWELLFVVCTGTDRIAHYFLHHADEQHVAHPADGRWADAMRDHYRHCDRRLGALLETVGADTAVLVVSDHGVQRLDGKLHLNDWLADNGFLVLEERPERPCPLGEAPVDWARTRAWASGFGGQVFCNLAGRYPSGWLDDAGVEQTVAELLEALAGLEHEDGRPVGVDAFRNEEVFSGPQRDRCPDLCLQLDGLRLLTRNAVGGDGLVSPPDADVASHAMSGFLAMAGPGVPAAGHCQALSIYDVAPTILDLLGVEGAAGLPGASLPDELTDPGDEVYSAADRAALASRLETLYLD